MCVGKDTEIIHQTNKPMPNPLAFIKLVDWKPVSTSLMASHSDLKLNTLTASCFWGWACPRPAFFAQSSLILNYCYNKLAKPNKYCFIPKQWGTFLLSNCIAHHAMWTLCSLKHVDVKNTHSVTKTEISVFGRQALDAERRRSPSLAGKVLNTLWLSIAHLSRLQPWLFNSDTWFFIRLHNLHVQHNNIIFFINVTLETP